MGDARLRPGLWVKAPIRLCDIETIPAVVVHRGQILAAGRPTAVHWVAHRGPDHGGHRIHCDRVARLESGDGAGAVGSRHAGRGPCTGLNLEFYLAASQKIAALDLGDIARVNAELKDFKGRMEQDDWIGQAKDLHFKKYGKTA